MPPAEEVSGKQIKVFSCMSAVYAPSITIFHHPDFSELFAMFPTKHRTDMNQLDVNIICTLGENNDCVEMLFTYKQLSIDFAASWHGCMYIENAEKVPQSCVLKINALSWNVSGICILFMFWRKTFQLFWRNRIQRSAKIFNNFLRVVYEMFEERI